MSEVFAAKAQVVQIHQKGDTVRSEIFHLIFQSCNKKRQVAKYCSCGTIVKKVNCVCCEKEFMGSYLCDFVQIIDYFMVYN